MITKRKRDSIYEMALTRADALSRLSNYSNKIQEHVTFCVAYGVNCNAFNGWVEELTAWLTETGSISVKKQGKFDYETYELEVFGALGDSFSDAKMELNMLLNKVKSGQMEKEHGFDYPEFEITRQMILELHSASNEIIQQMCGYFCDLGAYEKADKEHIRKTLFSIFEDVMEYSYEKNA